MGTIICFVVIDEVTECVGEICLELEWEEEPCDTEASFEYELIDGIWHFTNTSTGEDGASNYEWYVDNFLWSDAENPTLGLGDVEKGTVICFVVFHEIEGCVGEVCIEIELTEPCEMEVMFGMEVIGDDVYFIDETVDGPSDPIYEWYDDGVLFSDDEAPVVPLESIESESIICLLITSEFETCESSYCTEFYSELELSIDNAQKDEFKIYPNPTSGQFTIELNTFAHIAKIELYNLMGEKLLSLNSINNQTLLNVDLKDFDSGIYIIQIIDIKGDYLNPQQVVKH